MSFWKTRIVLSPILDLSAREPTNGRARFEQSRSRGAASAPEPARGASHAARKPSAGSTPASLRAQRNNAGATARGPWIASSQGLLAMTFKWRCSRSPSRLSYSGLRLIEPAREIFLPATPEKPQIAVGIVWLIRAVESAGPRRCRRCPSGPLRREACRAPKVRTRNQRRHDRACPGHLRRQAAGHSGIGRKRSRVDGRDKPGHDGEGTTSAYARRGPCASAPQLGRSSRRKKRSTSASAMCLAMKLCPIPRARMNVSLPRSTFLS